MISYALARLRPSNTHVLRRLSQFRAVANLLQPTNDAEADYAEARKWAAELGRDSIPKHLGHVRYDRSSGKGGQHVNTSVAPY
jgi:protein subunit release factor B